MRKHVRQSVDVIIPVYNSPELTKQCIDSVVTHLGHCIRRLIIHDDASNDQTQSILDHLSHSHELIDIYHAPKNQGFGQSVNTATKRSNADFVLVLNSDTEVYENILPPLCTTLTADPKLAVISPADQVFSPNQSNRYARQPGGYIQTYRFQGHAFLMRRDVFLKLEGFDPVFGRGYYEDIDLGRRLDRAGWRMGVHPDVYIYHKGGGTFGRGRAYRRLMTHNRNIYLNRYPTANHNILLVSNDYTLTDLPAKLSNAIENIFRQGGRMYWLTPSPVPLLYCLGMRNYSANLIVMCWMMLRGFFRKDKRISAIWVLPDISQRLKLVLNCFAYLRKLEIVSWERSAV